MSQPNRNSLADFAGSLARYRDDLTADPAEPYWYPFTIEFAGMPNAGKSLCVDRLSSLLRRAGFSCRTLPEQAMLAPIPDAEDPLFNLWTATTTLANIVEASQGGYDVVLVDRGVTDALFWFEWLRREGALPRKDHEVLVQFLNLDWWGQAGLTFVLTTSPSTALKRDYTNGLATTNGGIMNRSALTTFRDIIERTLKRNYPNRRRVVKIDSTRISPDRLVERVFHESLLGLSDSLDERIFAVPRTALEKAGLRPGRIDDPSVMSRILRALRTEGNFQRRSEVEADMMLIQPIPAAYFEYRTKLLLLRRKDGGPGNRLHNRYSLWVGGHIRDRDRVASQRDLFVATLRREVSEELRIPFVPVPKRKGLVWDTSTSRSEQHLGIIHRIELKTNEISVRADQSELRLPRGTSVSGTFQSRGEMGRYVHEMEPWSALILESLNGK
jgi:predicted NUDIX family phosphoesterase